MVSVCIASPSQNTRQLSLIKKAKVTSPEKVLQSFNTWAFKREQPSDPKLALRFVSQAIEKHTPIPFVLYWGKGPRSTLAPPDTECLDYLAAFASRLRESYARGASIHIVLTDTHARLNGHAQSSIDQYFGAIQDAAGERGFDCCQLSELVTTAGDIVKKPSSSQHRLKRWTG